MTTTPDDAARLAERTENFRQFVEIPPHNAALAIRLVEIGDTAATLLLPYDLRLAGNPDTGVLHGGAVTTLMDAACGTAVLASLPSLSPVATLDLRIDYLRPAEPGRDVIATATCYKLTRTIAFVRCLAHHGDEAHAIASGAATFMLSTRRTRSSDPPRPAEKIAAPEPPTAASPRPPAAIGPKKASS